MQLSLRDAARLLQVAERTIVKGVEQGRLRAVRVQDQLRFHRAELLEWATAHRIAVAPDVGARRATEAPSGPPSLADAIAAGGVLADVQGADRKAAIESLVERLALPAAADRAFLASVLLAREALGSTAIGDGIAIPHVRHPIVQPAAQPAVTVAYLARPIEFAAPDGRPVHTLFVLVSPTVRDHLHLLSRLAYALQDAAVRAIVARRGGDGELVAAVRAVETRLAQESNGR
jgi:PTS system nitrogen regulatory IIA component